MVVGSGVVVVTSGVVVVASGVVVVVASGVVVVGIGVVVVIGASVQSSRTGSEGPMTTSQSRFRLSYIVHPSALLYR